MSVECRNELVLRERRGTLSSSEALALEAHLAVCEACRMTREVGAAFEEQAGLDSEDGARIARLAARATRATRRPAKPRLARVALLAACLSLLAGGAAAAIGWVQRPKSASPTSLTESAKQSASDTKRGALAAPPPRTPAPAPSSAVDTIASVAAPAKPQPAAAPASAAQLFRKANEARRLGQTQQAIQLYRALQRDFPSSAEAALSPVSLGSLLLNRASAGAALEQFDHYLAASPGAALAAEALYGRARSLQALGRHAEEKRTWQQLLARFPGCPYRETARRRLTELP